MSTHGDIIGEPFSLDEDGDILIDGKIDQADFGLILPPIKSRVTLVSRQGSITITGKIDGGSVVTLSAANNIQIGTKGGDGDRKIDGGSNVRATAGGFISLGNKIDGGSIVSMNAGGAIGIGNKIDGGSNVLLKAGEDIEIFDKIDGGSTVRLSSGLGTHIHGKISNDATSVIYWPPGSLLVDGGQEGNPSVIAASS
jgi:hypothetical protein